MGQYRTGNIQLSTTPTNDLIAVIEEALAAAGWTKPFANYADGAQSTHTNRVWRCPTSLSGYASPFYLILSATTNGTGTTLYVNVAESADGTTGKFFNLTGFLATSTSFSWYINADGSFGNNATVSAWPLSQGSANTANSPQHDGLGTTVLTNTSNFTYWVMVTKRGVFIKTSITNNAGAVYAGLFESVLNNANEFPLARGGLWLGNGDTAGMAVTRRPGEAVGTTTTATNYAANVASNLQFWGLPLGILSSTSQSADVYGKIAGSRVAIAHWNSAKMALPGNNQVVRGILYDLLVFYSVSVTVGDTMTLDDGSRWVAFYSSGSYSLWVNRDAA